MYNTFYAKPLCRRRLSGFPQPQLRLNGFVFAREDCRAFLIKCHRDSPGAASQIIPACRLVLTVLNRLHTVNRRLLLLPMRAEKSLKIRSPGVVMQMPSADS